MTPAEEFPFLFSQLVDAEDLVQRAIRAHQRGYPDAAWQDLAALVVTLGNLHADMLRHYERLRSLVYDLERRESGREEPLVRDVGL